MVQLRTLRNIALGGAFMCVGTGLYFQSKIQSRFQQAAYYKESLRLLRQNSAVVEMLGQPIKDGGVDLADLENNYVDDLSARLKVPVHGKHNRGQLYLWASRNETNIPFVVDRLELSLKTEPNRRLIVYDRTKEHPKDSTLKN